MMEQYETAGWDHPTVLDSFERDGEWWMPGDTADARAAGRISFDPSRGTRLKTRRTIGTEAEAELGEGRRPPLILGFAGYGTPHTLYRTTREGRVRPPGGWEGSRYYARYLVDGHHFQETDGVAFASLLAGFTELEEWAGHQPFVGPNFPIDHRDTSYREIPAIEAEIGAIGARVTVRSYIPGWGEASLRTLRWEHRIVFEIQPDGERTLEWYREILDGIQDLFTLLVGRPVYPTGVLARTPGRDRYDARLYFDQGPRSPLERTSSSLGSLSSSGEVLLPLRRVRASLPGALQEWFAKRDTLRPVHELFFGALFGPRTGSNFQFLALAQALESYHRRVRLEAVYVPEKRYMEEIYPLLESGLPDQVSGALRERIKAALRFSFEWSLRKRIQHLFQEVPEQGVVDHDVGYFVGPVIKTRNHLTHHPEAAEDEVLQGAELMVAIDELRRLLAFFLLRELGLEEQEIVGALAGVTRYEYFPLD